MGKTINDILERLRERLEDAHSGKPLARPTSTIAPSGPFHVRLQRAAEFLLERVKEAVSRPSRPRTPATAGAPPRQKSGRLKYTLSADVRGNAIHIHCAARGRGGYNYPAKLEHGAHPFVSAVVRKYYRELKRIVGGPFRAFLSTEAIVHDHPR